MNNLYKKSKYAFFEEIEDGIFLHYNPMTNNFLLLNKRKHELLESDDKNITEDFEDLLLSNGFIVNRTIDELQQVLNARHDMIYDKSMYHVVVNTTLDCNLSCWYCYEKKIAKSKLSIEVIDAIKKNIDHRYSKHAFNTLKMSFFGGEPFLDFSGIQLLLDYCASFCHERNIELIADFTTNATLITPQIIDYLSNFRCHFQITLDGNEEHHNKVKIDHINKINTYRKTIEALNNINEKINRRWIALRINFDNITLKNISDILQQVDFLDRGKSYIILKKVWQVKTEKVDKVALVYAIETILAANFLVDYYVMPKGCVCFAERESQVLFNYDGKVFKCTTIDSFDDNNALGAMNMEKGTISWHNDRIETWYADMQPQYCKDCKWFPVCLGICNRQLVAHKGEHICTFDACNLNEKEYLMYLFKYNLLKNKLYKQ